MQGTTPSKPLLVHPTGALEADFSGAWSPCIVFNSCLQAALGELTYEVEAAERLRAELRGTAQKLSRAEARIAERDAALVSTDAARCDLERQLAAERAERAKRDEVEGRLSVRCLLHKYGPCRRRFALMHFVECSSYHGVLLKSVCSSHPSQLHRT